jgi:glycosyltransferase involved in cell wall biosynthesis
MGNFMTKQPKVSVIVPIFNVEKYLRECLDSIIGQTLKDMEIILIDDGSTDNCPEIVDEYAAMDKRIIAIHKKNDGLGNTYNTGLARATGEYIGMVEPDDWIEQDMYESLYTHAFETKAQIVKCKFYRYDSRKPLKKQNEIEMLGLFGKVIFDERKDAPKDVFDIEKCPLLLAVHSSVWAGVYESTFIKKIKFVEARGAGYSDLNWTIEALLTAEKIAIVPRPMNHWRMEDQGSSTLTYDRRCLAMAKRSSETLQMAKKSPKWNNDAIKQGYYIQALNANAGFYAKCDIETKIEYFKELRLVYADFKPEQCPMFSNDAVRYINFFKKGVLFRHLPMAWNFKHIKRWLLSLHINRKRGIIVQILGLQFATKGYADELRPALVAIRIYSKSKMVK